MHAQRRKERHAADVHANFLTLGVQRFDDDDGSVGCVRAQNEGFAGRPRAPKRPVPPSVFNAHVRAFGLEDGNAAQSELDAQYNEHKGANVCADGPCEDDVQSHLPLPLSQNNTYATKHVMTVANAHWNADTTARIKCSTGS